MKIDLTTTEIGILEYLLNNSEQSKWRSGKGILDKFKKAFLDYPFEAEDVFHNIINVHCTGDYCRAFPVQHHESYHEPGTCEDFAKSAGNSAAIQPLLPSNISSYELYFRNGNIYLR